MSISFTLKTIKGNNKSFSFWNLSCSHNWTNKTLCWKLFHHLCRKNKLKQQHSWKILRLSFWEGSNFITRHQLNRIFRNETSCIDILKAFRYVSLFYDSQNIQFRFSFELQKICFHLYLKQLKWNKNLKQINLCSCNAGGSKLECYELFDGIMFYLLTDFEDSLILSVTINWAITTCRRSHNLCRFIFTNRNMKWVQIIQLPCSLDLNLLIAIGICLKPSFMGRIKFISSVNCL